MILDKAFSGILDQSEGGCLEIFDTFSNDVNFFNVENL
jgi:hypothetical protein